MKIASPGFKSLSNLNPAESSATDSEATIVSVLPLDALCPKHKGRMPFGSLNATTPRSVIRETTAYAPFTRLCTPATA